MSSLRSKLRHLQKAARGKLAWLELPSGSTFYFDPKRTGAVLFLYAAHGLRAVREGESMPDPPEVLLFIAALPTRDDREKAFWQVYGQSKHPFVSFDLERFFDTGEIRPHPALKRKPVKPPPDESDGVVRIGKPPDYLR